MDQDSVHMVAASKVPMLKPGEYELWRMRMEQYIQMIDYSLWEVIENGNAPPITKVVEGVETTIAPTTAEEKAQRRLELKARSTLLMGIPNEHQLKFNSIKDAKSLLQAVEKRFGGNAATKKTQRNLLKQQYENFTASSSEVLDQTFDRLQKLISQLEIHGESISQEDRAYANYEVKEILKELRRKFSVNGTETIRFDKSKVECYNCHKRGHFARECRAPRNQENRNRENTRRVMLVETTTFNALVSCGYDWSDQAEEGNFMPPNPNLSFFDIEEFVNEHIVSEPTVKKPIVETSEAKASTDKPKVVRKNFGAPLIEDWILDSKDEAESKPKIEKKTVKPSFVKIQFVKSIEQVKSPRKTTVKQGDQNRLNTHSPRGNQRNWNYMMSQRLGSNFEMINKACYVCGSFDHLQYNCDNHQR
ncbi:ribonuclease H-like domain-containing protein [Tanacetum coccineum]